MPRVEFADIAFNANNTPVSQRFDDVYFSNQDGVAESRYVFLDGNRLWTRWTAFQDIAFVIGETGFGTGLNFFAVTDLFRQFRRRFPQSPLKRLYFISFEKYPLKPTALCQAHEQLTATHPEFGGLATQLQRYWEPTTTGCSRFHFDDTTLDIWFGDIADNLPQLGDYLHNKIDAWFLDGFSPAKNPDMWHANLYPYLYFYTKPNGTFATFTAASAVAKGLKAAGFQLEKRKGFGKKRECLSGIKPAANAKTSPNPTALSTETPLSAPYYLPQAAAMKTQDIAIIGGGIASLCTAVALLQRGARVTLYCEDHATALNASGNKQGAFYPQLSDDDERNVRFYLHAFAYGQRFLHWLISQGIEFEHEFCGVALCGYDAKSRRKLENIAQTGWHESLYQPLNAAELSEKSGISLPCGGGFIPQGAWLSPQQLVQNAFAFLQHKGINGQRLVIKTSQKVTALLPDESGWCLQTPQGEPQRHDVVVLANGHQVTHFEQTAKLPLYPVRGQVSQIPTTERLLKLKSVLCYDGYLTPADAAKQSHCLGASHVRDCDEREFRQAEQLDNALKIQRNIAADWTQDIDVSANIARIGVRCAVRDRVPLLGNVPDFARQQADYRNLFNLRRRKAAIPPAAYHRNLYLIAALGSRGLTSAPLLGETLASLIYGEPLPLSADILQNLAPNRYWVRKWLKGSNVE